MDAGREEAQSKATVIIPSAPIDKLPLLVFMKPYTLYEDPFVFLRV